METIVLLARTEPWQEAEDFFGSLGQLGKQEGQSAKRAGVEEWRNLAGASTRGREPRILPRLQR